MYANEPTFGANEPNSDRRGPTRRIGRAWAASIALIALASLPGFARGDDELALFVAEQKRLIDDPARPIADRERLARNLASTLDRAAQAAESEPERRERWAQAGALLDGFNRSQPGHSEATTFALQSAVYLWARAQSWLRQAESERGGEAGRRAAELLDQAIAGLRPIVEAGRDRDDPTARNARFRLAEALEDRAGLEPRGSAGAGKARAEALSAIGPGPIDDPALKGASGLLRARLLIGLDRFEEARKAIDEAEKADPPPPAGAIRDARLDASLGLGRFDEAWEIVRSPGSEAGPRELLAVRVRLAEVARGPESGRLEALRDAFRRVEGLRKDGRPEARPALLALDRALPEPGPDLGPEALELLAEGRLLAGDPAGAASLGDRASDRASALGRPAQAASIRYRAGAIRFRIGDNLGADRTFSKVVGDPAAGADRPKAALLLALARGRSLASGAAGATEESYARALADLIRDFPADPAADEARWLLGLVKRASGDPEGAEALWRAIPKDRPRGLDARLALAEGRAEVVAAHRLDPEPAEGRRLIEEARGDLGRLLVESKGPAQAAEVELARARLELIPGLGHPDEARLAIDRALSHPHPDDLDRRARRLRIVALALSGRYLDAEQAARSEAAEATPVEALALAADLDRAASESDSDVERRRIGGILRLVLRPILARGDALPARDRSEARLRDARARVFGGDPEGARTALGADPGLDPAKVAPPLLADLADLEILLDRPDPAIAAYRRLASISRAGSPPWFEARLGQAAALARSGEPRAALRLIEATRLLHPDLGGPATRSRFEKLESRAARDAGPEARPKGRKAGQL